MDERLKELRNHMTTTELKDIRFDDEKKKLVMKRIINQKKSSKNWWPKGLSIIFSLAIITIIFFSGKHLLFNSSNLAQGSKEIPEKIVGQEGITQSDNANKIINSNQDDSRNLSKKEILYRMLNTNDYFKTAQGAYVYQNPFTEQEIYYKVRMEKGDLAGYEKEVNKQMNITRITIVNNNKLVTLHEEQKKYEMSGIGISLNEGSISLEEVFGKDLHGSSIIKYRERPPIASDSLFPFEIAANYLQDESQWEIEQQEEKYLGEKVIVIKGDLGALNSEKHQSVSFKLWVHKSSGILMKMETYSPEGNVVNSLVTQKFTLDKSIPSSEFQFNIPKDFKKIEHH
ncbi:hypothetical protein MHB44_02955 [Lysinibacillus sp. FSL H8-0500]|uniref:hypothetical protein n=1 Tax=Lysinibacillus sp. FSL H8-0500 TaxID=2921393 RepID=UPI0031019580